jgi:hypothetical protein
MSYDCLPHQVALEMKIREELHAEMKSHLERQEAAQRARQEAERYDTQVASASKLALPPSLIWHYLNAYADEFPPSFGRSRLPRSSLSCAARPISASTRPQCRRIRRCCSRRASSSVARRSTCLHDCMHASLIACTPHMLASLIALDGVSDEL